MCLLSGLASFGQAAEPAFFMSIGDLPGGGVNTYVYALSHDGSTAVGRSISTPPVGFDQPYEAFRWTQSEGIVGLGDLNGGAVNSAAIAVSADGAVIVGDTDSGPFIWTAVTGMQPMLEPGGQPSDIRPRAISSDGTQVFGFRHSGGNMAARWTAATGVEELGALPNDIGAPDSFIVDVSADGTVGTGNSFALDGVHPIRWTPSGGLVGLGDVPGGVFYALGEGVSPDGLMIVGNARTTAPGGVDEAFIWTQSGGFIRPDPLHDQTTGSGAYAASSGGFLVVGYSVPLGGAFLWDSANGMRSIPTLLTEKFGLDLTGWTLHNARDISADGTVIVGAGRDPDGENVAWIARLPRHGLDLVPATSTWGLVALGLMLTVVATLLLPSRHRSGGVVRIDNRV